MTEFGRTAKENGTKGTDHGAASAIFLAGGLIKSSKVIADWPGLNKKELFEQRDLRQTTDARDVYGDVIHHAFNISKQKIKHVSLFVPHMPFRFCIIFVEPPFTNNLVRLVPGAAGGCLLYHSDAAD